MIAGPVEASTLGNIGIQLMTLDELNNVDDFRQVVSTTANLTTFTPNPDSEIAHYVAQIDSTRQTKVLSYYHSTGTGLGAGEAAFRGSRD